MTRGQWDAFVSYREDVRECCAEWARYSSLLFPLQEAAAKDTPGYPLETAVVYNRAYDEVTEKDEIRLLVVGDNPGKEEQLARNRRYLVGQSGRIAEGFFRRNPELGIDFRANVLILNKTPVHTAKTAHLRSVQRAGGTEVAALLLESQRKMAALAARLHRALLAESAGFRPQLWLVGYAELKGRGLFLPYRDTLRASYPSGKDWDEVFVFQHFSMNRFLIDLNGFCRERGGLPLADALRQLGHAHRDEIFPPSPQEQAQE